jgi:hypothetical protein
MSWEDGKKAQDGKYKKLKLKTKNAKPKTQVKLIDSGCSFRI